MSTSALRQSAIDSAVSIAERNGIKDFPSRGALAEVLSNLESILFPDSYGLKPEPARDLAAHTYDLLYGEILKELRYSSQTDAQDPAHRITSSLFQNLPSIRGALDEDAQAAFSRDPAAYHRELIVTAYPGFEAIIAYRLAHHLYGQGAKNVARLLSEVAHRRTGVDINPGAQIGIRFVIDHGTGVVIGETAVIGDEDMLYQGVTLGAISLPPNRIDEMRATETKRHPTVGNKVTIYAGATILGGETYVGDNTIIGGNVWLTHSVPSNSRVVIKEMPHQSITNGNGGGI